LALPTIHIRREGKGRGKEIDIRPLIREIGISERDDGLELFLRVRVSTEQNVRPREVLSALYGPMIEEWIGMVRISRTGLFSSNADGKGSRPDIGPASSMRVPPPPEA